MRCSPRRLVLGIVFAVLVSWLLFSVSSYFLNMRQKSILRYQLEQEMNKYWGKSLDPKTAEEEEEEKRGFTNNGFNQFRSDRLPLNREIPDTRDSRCVNKRYHDNLPSTSVVIIFHNEAYSTLLRTITSIINRTPSHLLHEIILVDDFSDHDDLKGNLETWISSYAKIKLFRHNKREGLIRARLTGAEKVTGEVMVFLDSHCECNTGWLEPLVERINQNSKTVVCPVIDVISLETLDYSTVRGPPAVRGGFNWGLQFKWKKIPDYEQKRREYDETREVQSPTMAGGLFAIHTKYFFELGSYDTGMEIWGGENLEISFRIWMCGGVLEIIPCSRVGHIFRKRQPYSFPGGVDHILVQNNMRLAEVWMDEYKEHYYAKRPGITQRSYGDISDRLALRQKLGCKSFRWYLENVYKDLSLPDQNLLYGGALKNKGAYKCLDTLGGREGALVGIYICHGQAGNQDFGFSDAGEIQFEEDLCLDVPSIHESGRVYLYNCHGLGGNQKWSYDNQTHVLRHLANGLCLDVQSDNTVVVKICDDKPSQVWTFSRQYHTNNKSPSRT